MRRIFIVVFIATEKRATRYYMWMCAAKRRKQYERYKNILSYSVNTSSSETALGKVGRQPSHSNLMFHWYGMSIHHSVSRDEDLHSIPKSEPLSDKFHRHGDKFTLINWNVHSCAVEIHSEPEWNVHCRDSGRQYFHYRVGWISARFREVRFLREKLKEYNRHRRWEKNI